MADHGRTRARGQHNITLAAQNLKRSASDTAGIIAKTGIKCHLATACQPLWHMHRNAMALQQIHSRQANFGVDLIDKATDEEGGVAWGCWHIGSFAIQSSSIAMRKAAP
jgi:hypothetical protein